MSHPYHSPMGRPCSHKASVAVGTLVYLPPSVVAYPYHTPTGFPIPTRPCHNLGLLGGIRVPFLNGG